MIVNSKTNNHSPDKSRHKESRNKPLPILIPEPPLQPDTCPLPHLNLDHTHPLSLSTIISLTKNNPRQSVELFPSNSNSKQTKQQPIPTNTANTNSRQLQLLTQIVVLTAELQRLSFEQEQSRRQSSDVHLWKQKYQDMLRRYKQGEMSFYKLTERNKQLENQIRYLSQATDDNLVSTRDLQIKSLRDQIKTSKQLSQSTITRLQSTNKRLESQTHQLRQLLQTTRKQKEYTSNQLSLLKTSISKYQKQIQNESTEISYIKQQLSRSEQQNRRLIQSVATLTDQLSQKQRQYNQNINTQISKYKEVNEKYYNECDRLNAEITRLKQKVLTESNNSRVRIESESQLKYQLELLKNQNVGLERSKHDATVLRNQLIVLRSKNDLMEIEVNQTRAKNSMNQDKIKELQNEVRILEQYKFENNQILMNYEAIKREMDDVKFKTDIKNSQMNNKVKLLQREIEYYFSQDKAKDGLIEKLNKQNSQLQKTGIGNGNVTNIDPDSHLLRKHLQLSVEQINRIYSHTKNIISDLTTRVTWLSKEKQQFLKKQQYQQFELQKLYQVLKTRKEELETCYRTIQGLRKTKEDSNSQDLNQILRNRREQLF